MPPLHRAVALEEIDGILVFVGEHLNLDVPRIGKKFLQINGGIAERRLCFRPRQHHGRQQGCLGMHDAHSASAASTGSLDDHGIADSARDLHDLLRVVG